MTAPAAPPTDLKTALVELRASMAARGTGKGLAARVGLAQAIEEAILRILALLIAMVEDFLAGRLAPIAPAAPVAEAPANGAAAWRAAVPPPPPRSAARLPARAGEGARGDSRRGMGVEAGEAGSARRIAGEATAGAGRGGGAAVKACSDAMRGPAVLRRRPRCGIISDGDIPPRRWRNARGVRHAVPPYGVAAGMAGASAGQFFKNAGWGGGTGTPNLFQNENDAIVADD